ncbi:MAG: S9 family peptidase [Candidatus Promineifilaceae bacterium]
MTYPLYQYINIRWAGSPTLSADGRYLAFLTDITGRFQAWQVELSGDDDVFTWPQQLTFMADRVLSLTYSPVPGDSRLLYGYDMGGSENEQFAVLDTASGLSYSLTEGFEESVHIAGEWAAETGYLVFAANRRDPAIFDLYCQPVDGGDAKMIWQHDQVGYLFHAIWSPDNQRIAFVREAKSSDHDLLELNLADGKVRQLSPQEQEAEYEGIAYSKDGRYLYVLTDLESDFLHIRRLELATGDWETLVAPNADVEIMLLSPNGRYLAYVTNREGDSFLELIDLATGVARPAPEPSTRPGVIGYYHDDIVFSADSQRLAFGYSSATRTNDIYVWNIDPNNDALVRKTDSSHGGIPVSQFVSPTLIHYPSFDDLQIPAFYYRPQRDDDEPLPVIIIVHGGPESQFRPVFNFFIQYILERGYAVLAPNVRGSAGYGNTYMHMDNVEKRMNSVSDLAHAARWLAEQPDIDAERIVVYGGSYGGFMVLSSLTTYPDLWAAGIDIVGISNFVTFLENTSDYRRAHRESEYGSLSENREFLESISPLNQVDQITAPLMVVHGANDPRVPLSEAQQLVDMVERRDIPVKFLVFDDEGHGIVKLKNKLELYPAVIEFLDEVLGA